MDLEFVAKLEPRETAPVAGLPDPAAGEPVTAELQAGDVARWEQIFTRLERRCMTLAWRILNDREAAADAVQEAFLRTYRSRASLRTGAHVDRWVISTVGNVALDALRLRKRGAKAASQIAEPRAASSDAPGEQEEWLWKALSQLDEQSRLTFLLVHQEGLSYAEVAAEFGWPPGTVRSKLHRTRLRLRELLAEGTSR